MDSDALDYTSRFNTALPSADEKRFRLWLTENSKRLGRDLGADLYDYDLRGQFKATKGAPVEPGHGVDTWKKPNHPTFSDESVYHGQAGLFGGRWGDGAFTPGATNLELHGADALRRYFSEVEPDIKLLIPAEPASPSVARFR